MMKFIYKKELFQNLGTKNEFYIKFRDKNNIFAKKTNRNTCDQNKTVGTHKTNKE